MYACVDVKSYGISFSVYLMALAKRFRLCIVSISLTVSRIVLTTSGTRCVRHFFTNPCLVLKVYNLMFYTLVICMYAIKGD